MYKICSLFAGVGGIDLGFLETDKCEIAYANEFDNIHILDWPSEVNNHPEYLYSDNTHLRPEATRPYVEFVKNGIYNYYLEKAKNELLEREMVAKEDKFQNNSIIVQKKEIAISKDFKDKMDEISDSMELLEL